MKRFLLLLTLALLFSCNSNPGSSDSDKKSGESGTVVKKRDDGTLSSVNQVDEAGRVHGLRVTYFEDGKTVYTKFTFKHGKKHGPSIRYYNNGQIYEHANFEDGEKHGITKKYYKSGSLMAEIEYSHGIVLEGLKEYDKQGELRTTYPTVEFTELNHLPTHDRLDLEIRCSEPYNGTKYYLIKGENTKKNRTYLITEKGYALIQLYAKPGETLNEKIEIVAEVPTELGNVYVRRYSHTVKVFNDK